MTVSYAWQFQRCDVEPSYEGLADVIRVVHWRYVATDGTNSAESYGEQALADPDPQNFTAFASVTSEMVEGWVTARMGEEAVTALQTSLADQLAALAAPALIPMKLETQ